jgi:outer membrane protein TolC
LIRAVLARNPEIEARRQAVRAARTRRSQLSALDDPEVAYSFAPRTIGSGTFGQTVQISQRFPWPGKRSSLGESAELEADAASHGVRVTELDLALEASLLFDDYFLVHRSLAVNEHHQHQLKELKSIAESQLTIGRASLQDPLQAEVELSRLVEEDASLRSDRDAIVSSLNGLLHRTPSEPLPAPPVRASEDLSEPAPEPVLTRMALDARPELRGLRARERAGESMARWARREYFPDFTLMASYSTMLEPDSRLLVGVSTPIPLQRGGRGGAVDEAEARIAELRSESARLVDRIRADVSVARHRIVQAIRRVKLLDGRTIPATKAQISAALADFAPGRTSFLAVVQAEKNLYDAELARNAAIAELGRWRARLDRALGRVPFSQSRGNG